MLAALQACVWGLDWGAGFPLAERVPRPSGRPSATATVAHSCARCRRGVYGRQRNSGDIGEFNEEWEVVLRVGYYRDSASVASLVCAFREHRACCIGGPTVACDRACLWVVC